MFHSFYNEGSKSRELNGVLKTIFNLILELDIVLNLAFVRSENNLADEPSRVLKKSDATLSEKTWYQIQGAYGKINGHSLDLFSLDSNAMIGRDGKPLRHFTPFWTPNTAGVNVFLQQISPQENCYAFPPFNLLVPLIKFIDECRIDCTVVIPAYDITPVWMPVVADMTQDALLLGLKGQKGVLRYPTKKGYVRDKYGLPWNLWALRLSGKDRIKTSTFGKFLFLCGANKTGASSLLCVGDSMIRFLEWHHFMGCAMAVVMSKGGALIHEVTGLLSKRLMQSSPGFIFVNAGVNNLSKTYLFQNEMHLNASAIYQFSGLENVITKYAASFPSVKVIISSVTVTKDGRINARAINMNKHIEHCCAKNGWHFMDNENITTSDLKDTVHFNKSGEEKFLANLQDALFRAVREQT